MEDLNTNGTSVYDYIVKFTGCKYEVEKEKQSITININIYIEPFNSNIPMPDYRFPKIWF